MRKPSIYAIQLSGNGPIILEGVDISCLLNYIRVNPTCSIVKKVKNKWKICEIVK